MTPLARMEIIFSNDYLHATDPMLHQLKLIGFEFAPVESEWFKGRVKPTNDVFIEIETIEELNNFVNTFGMIVYDGCELEIYNDYRE